MATQQENADLARKRAAFTLGRLQNMSGADRYAAIKQANAIVDAYARGNQSLKSMNQALSQHLSTQRSIARNNSKQAKQSGKGKNLAHLVGLHAMHLQFSQLISCWDQPQPHSGAAGLSDYGRDAGWSD